jgi:hypothetical protein
VSREALQVFSKSFPLEYPEIEALVVLQRKQFRFEEVPCQVRPRLAGISTITAAKSIYYILHVLLGVFVNVLRLDGRRRRMSTLQLRTEFDEEVSAPEAESFPASVEPQEGSVR